MFSKLALFAAASFAVFVVALPGSGGIDNSCKSDSDHIYCCNEVQLASSTAAQQAIKNANIKVAISGTVGLTCKPMSLNDVKKQSCTSQLACCTGMNYSSGAVVVGCSPTSVSV